MTISKSWGHCQGSTSKNLGHPTVRSMPSHRKNPTVARLCRCRFQWLPDRCNAFCSIPGHLPSSCSGLCNSTYAAGRMNSSWGYILKFNGKKIFNCICILCIWLMFYTTNILQSLEKSGESKTEIMENLNHVQKHKGGKVDSLSYCPNLTRLAVAVVY